MLVHQWMREVLGISHGVAVDFSLWARGAPDDVGIKTDDRIAPAHRSAFNRFQ